MRLILFAGFAFAVAGPAEAPAQTYPEHPIRIIVPFAAGGTVDIVARIVGAKLTDIAGSRVIVDNRGGAGGVLGTEFTARSPGDGYTLLLHSASIAYDPSLHDKLPYNTMKDLVPVAMIGSTPNLLVVSPAFRARSVTDLLAIGREKPGSATFATGGFGSSSHLAVALFSYLSGVKFAVESRDTHQPTKTATGSTRTSSASTNHSVRVGWPSMSMVCLPVVATTSAELAMKTANPASTGAERGHSRRTSAPGRNTAGRPRSRNHASAARRCVTSIMHGPPVR